jgi:hypothetical protein
MSDPASPAPPAHGDEDARSRSPLAVAVAIVTLIVAVWGAVTGTIAWSENRSISVHTSASAWEGFYSFGSYVVAEYIHVDVINTSSKAINITRAEVLLNGKPVGLVTSAYPEYPGAVTVPLPANVTANGSADFAMEWSYNGSTGEKLLRDELSVPASKRQLSLRLTLEPGGTRLLRVTLEQRPSYLNSWYTLAALHNDRVQYLILGTGAFGTGSVLATLRVWDGDPRHSEPVLTESRPAADGMSAWFSLASLPPGGYVYIATDADDKNLAVGVLQTDCAGKDDVYLASACTYGKVSPQSKPASPTPTPPGTVTE